MKIAIGCDHTVTDIKNKLIKLLETMNHEVIDCGTKDNERTHYPIFGHKVGVLVATNKVDKGIILCGTGVGIANSVNKIKGVRCALVREPLIAQKAVSDFDINVIAFGGWINGIALIEEIVTTFVNAKYENKNKDIIKTINDLIVNENYQDDILKKKFCFEKKENITISAKYK